MLGMAGRRSVCCRSGARLTSRRVLRCLARTLAKPINKSFARVGTARGALAHLRTFGRSSLGSWGGGGSATPRGANHALYVLADPAEPPDVAGDESEGDRVQALSCRRVRTCHRGEVDLHPHLALEHGWRGGAPLVLEPERDRREHGVLQVGHREEGVDQVSLDRGKRLALHHHCVALVLLCRHETSKPASLGELGRAFWSRVVARCLLGHMHLSAVEPGAAKEIVLQRVETRSPVCRAWRPWRRWQKLVRV